MDVKLVMYKRDGRRKDFRIHKPKTVLGRAEDCDLRIPLLSVSRKHCELILGDDELRVRDLASSNGTFVNSRRITETALKPGDRLVIGPVVFTVQIDGVPEQIAPVRTKTERADQTEAAAPAGTEDEVIPLEPDDLETAAEGDDSDLAALDAALEAMVEEEDRKEGNQKD
ncbi:MAG: hypothetical protein B1H04_03305 [Planctomycetales bacterium 4484_123]|nr:MAG: hypothetical protein B1H04_03305 [Planctomycetales bacterium 4484_123]